MNWKKVLLPPVAIYAVIFLFISALIGAKVDQTRAWVWVVSLVITIVGLYVGSRYTKPRNALDGLKYGVMWLIILVIFDLILTAPFAGWDYFSDWRSYVPYMLTLLVPSLYPLMNASQNTLNAPKK